MFPRQSWLITAALALSFFTLSACQSASKNPLQLDNVLQYEEERQARIKAKEEKRKAEELAAAANIPSPAPTSVSIKELTELKLPSDFKILSPGEVAAANPQLLLPGAQAGWADGSGIRILTGTNPLNTEGLKSLTEEAFLEELKNTAMQYDAYYRAEHKTGISFEISQLAQGYRLLIECRYETLGQPMKDERFIYFHRPEFRLNLLITGPDAGRKNIAESIQKWEPSLSGFSKPLGLQKKS